MTYAEATRCAFDAIELAEYYKWHNLRKDERDLPLNGVNFGVAMILGAKSVSDYCIGLYYKNFNGYSGFVCNGFGTDKLIAWKYLNPYTED